MLVLSRRTDEEIVLPDLGVTIKVLRTSGNQIRLGISAPSDVRILRGELAEFSPWEKHEMASKQSAELAHAM